MCPACLATLLLTAGGTGTATGLVALTVRSLTNRRRPKRPADSESPVRSADPKQPHSQSEGERSR